MYDMLPWYSVSSVTFAFFLSLFFRWLCSCSSIPCQPLPSEPASSPYSQPDAGQPHARRLRRHARAHGPLLHARSAHQHGPPCRDGPHGPRDARNGDWRCRRCGDECGDSGLRVHAPAPDEHAAPGRDATHRNHQPLPFVRGRLGDNFPQTNPLLSLFLSLPLWLLKKLHNEQGEVLSH